jgi:hypothetical protein
LIEQTGALDKVEECFFFHSFMNQDPGEDLLDLPQEPQVEAVIFLHFEGTDTDHLELRCQSYSLVALTFPLFHFMHWIRSVHIANFTA